jgi:hypothetical protein
VKLVNPVVEASTVGATLAPRLTTLEGATIGLWSNRKLNADELLSACEVELRSRHRIAGTVRGFYHPARVLAAHEWGAVDSCDAVILTHGD